jgi:hypothetical protein
MSLSRCIKYFLNVLGKKWTKIGFLGYKITRPDFLTAIMV